MGLTCRIGNGNYAEIFKELVFKLHLDQRNIYLLNGPVDILLQLNRLKNIEEFMAKWFNPVRMIGAHENLITKILSFIVISAGPLPVEKPFAFVFMNTQPRNLETVRTALLTFPQVLSADSAIGPYGVISSVRARDNADCERVVSSMESIPGIQDLTTSIVDAMDLFPDW